MSDNLTFSPARTKAYWTPERRAAHSAIIKASPNKPAQATRGYWTPEKRAAHSKRMQAAYESAERRKGLSRRLRRLWADGEYRAKQEAAIERSGSLEKAWAARRGGA